MNIAEILKNYPKGTKLYSPICGECQFISINIGMYPIHVSNVDKSFFYFTEDGKYSIEGECLLFPSKDNRDWNTMMKPKFKKGDFVFDEDPLSNPHIMIYDKLDKSDNSVYTICCLDIRENKLTFNQDWCCLKDFYNARLATKEEKQILLEAINEKGYEWDEEKLEVREKQKECCFATFDKVLVRDSDKGTWRINLFSHFGDPEDPYVCMISVWKQCIPYEGNQELLGTCNEPNHKQYEN